MPTKSKNYSHMLTVLSLHIYKGACVCVIFVTKSRVFNILTSIINTTAQFERNNCTRTPSRVYSHRGKVIFFFHAFSNTLFHTHTHTNAHTPQTSSHILSEHTYSVWSAHPPHTHVHICTPLPSVKGIIHFHILLPHTHFLSISAHTRTHTHSNTYTLVNQAQHKCTQNVSSHIDSNTPHTHTQI